MLYRILIAWLYALVGCVVLFVALHTMLGMWQWSDPIFRRYAIYMVALLSIVATTPIYRWWLSR